MWRFAHNVVLASGTVPIAAYGGLLSLIALVAQVPNAYAKAFVDNQVIMWRALVGGAYSLVWFATVATVWVVAWLWTAKKAREEERRHRPYETLAEKLPGTGRDTPQEIAQDNGPAALAGLYIGNIIASAGHLRDDHFLEFAVRGFNGTGVSISIMRLEGRIRAGSGNLRDMPELPVPALVTPATADPGTEFQVVLNQHLTPKLANDFLLTLETGMLKLDLRGLSIMAEAASDRSRAVRLPTWDALTLRRRDDVVSGRMTIVSADITLGPVTATMSATLIRGPQNDAPAQAV